MKAITLKNIIPVPSVRPSKIAEGEEAERGHSGSVENFHNHKNHDIVGEDEQAKVTTLAAAKSAPMLFVSPLVKHPADSERLQLVNPHFRPGVFTPSDSCQANSFETAATPGTSKNPLGFPRLASRVFLLRR
jgi:hypothetical protein